MKGTKNEMITVQLDKKAFEQLVLEAVYARYPFLNAGHMWEWEDAYIAKDVFSTDFPDTKVALELVFTKREELLDKPCPCAVNSVCR